MPVTHHIADAPLAPIPAPRPVWPALRRGLRGACPNCGRGRLFARFLKVSESCGDCREELHHHRADDAPPYFTIFIAGHILVPVVLAVERIWTPDLWVHMALWLPATIALCLALLPPVKGALVGLQWALRMHGFDGAVNDAEGEPVLDRPLS